MARFDVVVVGLGALGSATVLSLARRGLRVLGLDRFAPPHTLGSTHGETRMTRLAVGEGPEYVPLALRSHAMWREIEAESGESLFIQCGALIVGREHAAPYHGRADFLGATIALAERFGIAHQVLDGPGLADRFPQCLTRDAPVRAYFEPEGGILLPERCVAVQLELARRHGAEIRVDTRVAEVRPGRDGAAVRLSDGETIACGQVLVTAGAWTRDLVPTPVPLVVHRQVLHWMEVEDPALYAPDRFPAFVWMHEHGDFYGMAIPPGGVGLKLGTERFDQTVDAEHVDRSIGPDDAGALYRGHIAGRLAGVTDRVLRSAACLYTMTPDSHFAVSAAGPGVLVASACSGHGFKHSAALGEAIAGRIAGAEGMDLSPFGLAPAA